MKTISFMWLQLGKHKIKIRNKSKLLTVWVNVDKASFKAVKSDFDFQVKEIRAKKFIALDAQERNAAFFIEKFELREDGIYCIASQQCQDWELKGMTCAAAFTTDAKLHNIKGETMPAVMIGSSKMPASVIGLPMTCYGMVNTMRQASFRKMKPILERA